MSDSSSDFDKLKASLTEKIKALLEQGSGLEQIANASPVNIIQGLSQLEIMVLAIVAGEFPGYPTPMQSVKVDAERAGVTSMGFILAIRKLVQKGLAETYEAESDFSDQRPYTAVVMCEAGWDWIIANESNFVLLQQVDKKRQSASY